MRVMILAAGLGSRLQPLTLKNPKALTLVNNKPLIHYLLENLKQANFKDIVINVSYLKDKIIENLKSNDNFGLNIKYSIEDEPLETGGGIFNALNLLGEDPFLLINSDIYTDFNFGKINNLNTNELAHLVMVNKPSYKPHADFYYHNGSLDLTKPATHTYAGIAIISPKLFSNQQKGKFSLTPILKQAINDKLVSASCYEGFWFVVDTITQLKLLEQKLTCL